MSDTELYGDAFNQTAIGLFIVNSEHVILDWNQWLVEKTSIEKRDAVGKKLEDIFPTVKNNARYKSSIYNVIKYRSYQVLSQSLNRYLIPIENKTYAKVKDMEYMQQQVSIAPIMKGDDVFALINITDVTENVLRANSLIELTAMLEDTSNRDHLTQAYNRRFLFGWLDQHVKLAIRNGFDFCCLMLDIDYFKRINDTYGHDVGDKVLKQITSNMQNSLRDFDLLARYGGEEFIIVLPRVSYDKGFMIAERIRKNVSNIECAPLLKGQLTISIGLVIWSHLHPVSSKEIITQADEQLYEAKRNGRNRVESQEGKGTITQGDDNNG